MSVHVYICVPCANTGNIAYWKMNTSSASCERGMKTLVLSTDAVKKCGLCNEQKSKYTCPKCSVLYCSLTCYRSYGHAQCSENFFKELALKELENHNQTQSLQEMKENMETLLRKNREMHENDLDSDDSEDDNQEDLLDRMENVDLNDSDMVWDRLNEKEKSDFQKKISTGEIVEFLPNWDPWWIKTAKNLIEDLDIPRSSDIPPIKHGVPLLSTMMKRKPNEAVVNGLANILYGYACISRLFMQDWTGNVNSIIEILLTVSEILCTNLIFNSAQEAVDYAYSSAFKLDGISHELSLLVKHDIVQILKQHKFVLASLSDVAELLHSGIDTNFVPRKRLLLAMKKVEFYMSFVNEYGVRTLKFH